MIWVSKWLIFNAFKPFFCELLFKNRHFENSWSKRIERSRLLWYGSQNDLFLMHLTIFFGELLRKNRFFHIKVQDNGGLCCKTGSDVLCQQSRAHRVIYSRFGRCFLLLPPCVGCRHSQHQPLLLCQPEDDQLFRCISCRL